MNLLVAYLIFSFSLYYVYRLLSEDDKNAVTSTTKNSGPENDARLRLGFPNDNITVSTVTEVPKNDLKL